ncbi:hypothetical protein N7G274_008349 [Stereocaulon virgatum]|uniref:Uncharacterized protein n=1 Tax=Stereocaulon virgatum TaxID=373712 RepID=A0ABR4A0J8_9LECA
MAVVVNLAVTGTRVLARCLARIGDFGRFRNLASGPFVVQTISGSTPNFVKYPGENSQVYYVALNTALMQCLPHLSGNEFALTIRTCYGSTLHRIDYLRALSSRVVAKLS